MKKIMTLLMAIVISSFAWGQTVLISPTGDGGFESGADFASNGWTVSNCANNPFVVGTALSTAPFSNRSAYISNDAGTSNNYSNNSATLNYFYRDVTVPAGESIIKLTFNWVANGESTWDIFQVFTAPTTVTPVGVATYPGSGQTNVPSGISGATCVGYGNLQTTIQTFMFVLPADLAGTTFRLIFSWKNDGSGGSQPAAAFDNISLTSVAPSPLNGLYSINNTIPTTTPMVHDGTSNFNNFTDAINYLNVNGISASVTFNVADGQIFAEDCPAILATGTASNTITFQKSGAGTNPVIQPTGTTGSTDAGITITGGDYITFDGIDIEIATGSAVEYGYLIRNATVTNGAQHNTIKNSKIILNRSNTSSRGIYQYRLFTASSVEGANSYNTYEYNTIENSYQGIYLTGSSAYPDIDCVVSNSIVGAATANDIGGGSVACNGIRASYQYGIAVADNAVRNVFTTTGGIFGIYLEGAVGTNNVYNNNIYSLSTTGTSNLVYGIRTDINATHTTNVFNNMISDLNHGATSATATQVIRAMAVGVSGTGTGNFIHNSVLISEDAFPSSTAMYINGGVANVYNNIFANQSAAGATSKRYCIYRGSGTLVSDYNDLFIDDSGTNNFTGYFTADRATLANWQAASGSQDMNSIVEDPAFVGPTDLHTNNPAFNGTALAGTGITFDIDMDPRDPDFPDMGADENLTPVAFTCTTPIPGNTIASANAICFGQSVTFSLQNVTAGTGVGYQWQSSPDNATYTDILGATSSVYSEIPNISAYYQCVVTCQNGPASTISTPVHVTFANSILSTTPAIRCGTGTVSLAATATSSATVSWYDAVTDTLMGTGSPWTTPIISATTTFNVAAEIPALGAVLGDGTLTSSGSESPFYHLWGGHKSQFLILASELTDAGFTAGDINTLGINVVAPGGVFNDFNLNVGPTSDVALTTTFVSGLNNVYSNPTLSFTAGYNTFVFAVPYNWDGTSNIVIEFCWSNNNSGNSSLSASVKYDATSFVAESYYRADNLTAAVLCATATASGTYSFRPQFYLNYTPICAGERVPVIASVSTAPVLTLTADQAVCNNSVATIAVTSTLGNYDSYIWTPETDLFTDLACTMPYASAASATTVYVKTATAASITYTCMANNSVTQCSEIETSTVIILPASPIATASPEEICLSGASTITIDPATGYGDATFQWQNSTDNLTFTDIAGANSVDYNTPVLTNTTYYKLLVKLGALMCTESNVVTINVNNPQVLTTTPASRCGTGTVTLGATGSVGTTLNWFDAATGGIILGSGTSFTTPVISTTTDYYVAAGMGETITYGGRLAPTATTTTSASSWGLVFDAYNDFTLETVEVYATAAGNVVVQLQSNTGAVIQSATVPVIAGSATTPQVLSLNFDVTAGTGLRLIAVSSPAMVRESSVGGFPYLLGTNGEITSGYISGTSTSYYYFYNWQIKTGCTSARTMVTATVNTPPSIAITATPNTICAGASTTLNAASSNDPNYTYVWTPGSLTGATQIVSPTSNTTYHVIASDNTGGTNDGCITMDSVSVIVNPLPTAVTASASENQICEGSSIDLFSSAVSNASYTIDYNEGFETWPPVAWTLINAGTGNPWTSGTEGHTGTKSLKYGYNTSNAANAWAITGPLTLTAGTTNTISFWYKIAGNTFPEKLKVTVGSDATVVAQTTTLWDNNGGASLTNTVWAETTITYTPSTSGTYYFGFNCYSDANMFNLFVDDVSISASVIFPATYSWASVPAGYTSLDQNPTGILPATTTEYIVTAENIYGCTATASTTVIVDDCTGIENDDNINVTIVPNPSNGQFYINVNGMEGTTEMNIYSMSGQIIYSEQIDCSKLNNKPMDISAFSKGIYFIRLVNKNASHTEKIIIE